MSEHAFICRYIDMTIYITHHVLNRAKWFRAVWKDHDTLFTANDSLMFFISFSACQGHMPKKSYQNGISSNMYIYICLKGHEKVRMDMKMVFCVYMCHWKPKKNVTYTHSNFIYKYIWTAMRVLHFLLEGGKLCSLDQKMHKWSPL